MILHILYGIPNEFATTIKSFEEDLSELRLNLQLLKDIIRPKYQRIKKEKVESMESIELITKAFKGMSNFCRIIGHKVTYCFTMEKNKDDCKFMKKRNKNITRNKN
jgi:hypothetical protein